MPAPEKHWIDQRHYRVLSADGRRSYLYLAGATVGIPDRCIEIEEHRPTRPIASAPQR